MNIKSKKKGGDVKGGEKVMSGKSVNLSDDKKKKEIDEYKTGEVEEKEWMGRVEPL